MDAARIPGRVTISARAYERVAAAVLADELGVPARASRAHVRDAGGALALDLTSGIRADGDPIAASAAAARARTGERVSALTGAVVGDIRLRITHLVTQNRSSS
ncbi:hypothetical protein [Microbacterium hominis]|uniref:Asp23/Gls24 family envelope stress response protein n=1 Tax=Microbacterium hominis TaxID=162426 RepID=A0A0B4CB66_9MICO|nr:hypothetical protein [Microbacterium hominis]KIC58474.1 hypothetical protein RM52_05410 [Microbacterium hominis]